jgi:predicted GNAT family N-acyltransferase
MEPALGDCPAVVRQITTIETFPLRLAVLRPGRPVETAQFSGDDDQTTRHFGVFTEGRLVGIATLLEAPLTEEPGRKAYQLRGMATAEDVRGKGFGKRLVEACLAYSQQQEAELVWCNARVAAAGFYSRLGFEVLGEEFHIPDVGPHFRMRKWLKLDLSRAPNSSDSARG